jgi:hypothetical protein
MEKAPAGYISLAPPISRDRGVPTLKSSTLIFLAKAARVTAFGIVSIMTPIYLTRLGYSPIYVGVSLLARISNYSYPFTLLKR